MVLNNFFNNISFLLTTTKKTVRHVYHKRYLIHIVYFYKAKIYCKEEGQVTLGVFILVDTVWAGEGEFWLVIAQLLRGKDTQLIKGWLQLLKYIVI